MLIAEVGGGRGSLCYKHFFARKQFFWIQGSQWEQENWFLLSGLYRSGVSDEDLGMSVGELISWDLEVGHQHLHSFPMESQRGHACHPLHTWHCNWPQITQRQKPTKISLRWSQHEWTWHSTENQLNTIVTRDRADRICAFPSTQGRTRQVWAALNTGER